MDPLEVNEEGEEGTKDWASVRAAQQLTGGLLWLSGRTRPDIAFAVSRMSSQSTTNPQWSLRVGKLILRYLLGTKYHVLLVVKQDSNGKVTVDVYADASFEPDCAQTGIGVYVVGVLVEWRSVKQAQVPRSTAESEVTSLALGGVVLEGVVA